MNNSRTERTAPTAPKSARASGRDDGRAKEPNKIVKYANSSARSSNDSLGKGMELAITVLIFLGLGYLIDHWLGLFPVFTIGLVVFASIGSFIQMKYTYDAHMDALQAQRAEQRNSANSERSRRSNPETDNATETTS